MTCDKCIAAHHIPEYIFVCKCECHTWTGFPKESKLELSINDCKVLYNLIKNQYIHYGNIEAHKLIKRISELAHKDELAR